MDYSKKFLNQESKSKKIDLLTELQNLMGGSIGTTDRNRGGDRFSSKQYGGLYATYLQEYIEKTYTEPLIYCEIGILLGHGLGVFSKLFPDAQLIGLDINLDRFIERFDNEFEDGDLTLEPLNKVAFQDDDINLKMPIGTNRLNLYEIDQLADVDENSKTISKILSDKKLNIIVDDGLHTHQSIVNTFKFLEPYFAKDFIYFIEDLGNCTNGDVFNDINLSNAYKIVDSDANMMIIKYV